MNLVPFQPAIRGSDFTGHLEDEWLVFSTAPGPRHGPMPTFEQMLAWNATLAGAAKFGLSPDLEPQLQAQIPARDFSSGQHETLAAATAEGIAIARLLWQESALGEVQWPESPATQDSPGELAEACAEAGWKTRAHEGTGLTVDLGGAGPWCHARVATLLADGGTSLEVDLVTATLPSPASLRALTQLLLLVGGMLRWARPVMRVRADGLAGGLQILLPGVPTPADLDDALTIFAVAGDVWGHEATALLDPDLARDYLAATAAPTSV